VSAAVSLFEACLQEGPVLLTGPLSPDGDSIGACLALARLLVDRGQEVHVAGDAGFRYAWLPRADTLRADEALAAHYPTVVVLDGDRHRLTPRVEQRFAQATNRCIIDHHASTDPDGYTHYWVQPNAASTCTMLYEQLEAFGGTLDPELATLLYTGLVFDTGGFRYTNTTGATLRMAAALVDQGIPHASISARVLTERRLEGLRLAGAIFAGATTHFDGQLVTACVSLDDLSAQNASPEDLEGVIDALVHVHGAHVAMLCIEQSPGKVKYSFRSRNQVDVAAVARSITPHGGGHAKASGARLTAPLDDAYSRGLSAFAQVLG